MSFHDQLLGVIMFLIYYVFLVRTVIRKFLMH